MSNTHPLLSGMIVRTVGPDRFWSSSPTLATFRALGGRVVKKDVCRATYIVTSFAISEDGIPDASDAFTADLEDFASARAAQERLQQQPSILDMAAFKDLVLEAEARALLRERSLRDQVKRSMLDAISPEALASFVGI